MSDVVWGFLSIIESDYTIVVVVASLALDDIC